MDSQREFEERLHSWERASRRLSRILCGGMAALGLFGIALALWPRGRSAPASHPAVTAEACRWVALDE